MTYLANDKYNANLNQGYTVGDTTLYVDAVPTNVPTIVVVNYSLTDETVFNVTGKTSNSLTGVSRRSGSNTNIANGATITCLNNSEFINQYQTAIFSAENLSTLIYGADGGSTDTYAVSLNPAPTSYANIIGVPISITFNTANTGPATLNINSLGAVDLKKSVSTALATGDIFAGQAFIVIYDGTNFQMSGFSAPTSATRAEIATGTSNVLAATPQNLKEFHTPPEGFLYNGKIEVTGANNDITISLKGKDGNDPSATNPVYIEINNVLRTITTTVTMSFTLSDGSNTFNAGSAELATKEIDYFVFLCYNASNSTMGLGVTRKPGETIYTIRTGTTEGYMHFTGDSGGTSSGDGIQIIGRFAATKSAASGYLWSIPTFTPTNLIQGPIYETRVLDYVPTITGLDNGSGAQPTINVAKYQFVRNVCKIWTKFSGTKDGAGKQITFSPPMAPTNATAQALGGAYEGSAELVGVLLSPSTTNLIINYQSSIADNAGSQVMSASGSYTI